MTREESGAASTPEENFVTNMRLVREARGWSQAELAEALRPMGLDLHRQTIQKIESGLRPVKLNEAHIIAAALGDHVDEMVATPSFKYMINELLELDAKIVAAQKALEDVYKSQLEVALVMDAHDYTPSENELKMLTLTHREIHESTAMQFRYRERNVDAMQAEWPESVTQTLDEERNPENMGAIQRKVFELHRELGLRARHDRE